MNKSIQRVNANLYRQIREHINQTIKSVKLEEDIVKQSRKPAVMDKFMQQHSQKDCNCFKKRFLSYIFGVNTVPCEHCIYSRDYKKWTSLEHFGISDQMPSSAITNEQTKVVKDEMTFQGGELQKKSKRTKVNFEHLSKIDHTNPVTEMISMTYFGLRITCGDSIVLNDICVYFVQITLELIKEDKYQLLAKKDPESFRNLISVLITLYVYTQNQGKNW